MYWTNFVVCTALFGCVKIYLESSTNNRSLITSTIYVHWQAWKKNGVRKVNKNEMGTRKLRAKRRKNYDIRTENQQKFVARKRRTTRLLSIFKFACVRIVVFRFIWIMFAFSLSYVCVLVTRHIIFTSSSTPIPEILFPFLIHILNDPSHLYTN